MTGSRVSTPQPTIASGGVSASATTTTTTITSLPSGSVTLSQGQVNSIKQTSSPIKLEPQPPASAQQQPSPKLKFAPESGGVDHEMGGDSLVDLQADKKSQAAAATSAPKVATNLDQIKLVKDEKFLNVIVLHKKFVELSKKHKIDDVAVDVAALISHATQEFLRGLLEKLNVVAQHRLDMSMRVCYNMTKSKTCIPSYSLTPYFGLTLR